MLTFIIILTLCVIVVMTFFIDAFYYNLTFDVIHTQTYRKSFKQLYMELAKGLATRSKCERLKVGCVITSSDYRHIFGSGYNGDASNQDNGCKNIPGQCEDLHAELNAILNSKCSREDKKYVFCTTLPCIMCSKALVNFGGVEKVYFSEDYRDKSSLKIFKKAKIKVIKL